MLLRRQQAKLARGASLDSADDASQRLHRWVQFGLTLSPERVEIPAFAYMRRDPEVQVWFPDIDAMRQYAFVASLGSLLVDRIANDR